MKAKLIVTETIVTSKIDTDKITDTHVKRAIENLINGKKLDNIQTYWIHEYCKNRLTINATIEVSNLRE